MVNYGEAIKKPFSDITKYIIGVILSVIPIVNWIAIGYALETSKKVMKKDNKLPEWSGLGAMWVKGLIVTVITLIYFIPALVLGGLGGLLLIPGLGAPILGIVLLIVAGLVGLATIIVLPMALMNYAKTDSFAEAFSFSLIVGKALTGTNIITLLVLLAITVVVGIIAAIPVLGQLIMLLASFFITLTAYIMFAEVYMEA